MNLIKREGGTLRERYFDVSGVIVFYILAAFTVTVVYRGEIFSLMRQIYPELRPMSFNAYLLSGIRFDCAVILAGTLLLALLLFFAVRNPKAAYSAAGALLILQAIFFFMAVDFFKIYQTTFQMNFFGEENATDLRSLLMSSFAELSAVFFVKFALSTAFIAGTAVAFYFRNQYVHYFAHNRFVERGKAWRLFVCTAAPLLVVALLSGFAAVFRHGDAAPLQHGNSSSGKKMEKLLREVAMNPAYNLLFTGGIDAPGARSRADVPASGSFSFKFRTDSFESDAVYRRSSLIPRGKKYNIILYFFESTSAKYLPLKVNGREVVPTWNRLARNSLNLTRHYANYPLSANAMLSVFTSAYDWNDKKLVIQTCPDIPLKTASELLHEHGYRTLILHTGGLEYAGQHRFLKNRMFDHIWDYRSLKRPPYTEWVGWGLDERALIKPCVQFIDEKPDQPFFIAIFPVSPHHPYPIPDPSFQITGEIPDGTGDRQKVWLKYLNSLYYSDAALGQLVDTLEKKGCMDDTLFILFADHGEAFYQHRMNYNHPFFLYEENVQVPCLIYNKKLFPEAVYFDGVTRHIDILPTILDILRMPAPPEEEGISILGAHREQFALFHTSWKDDYMGIRDGRWKYIRRTQDQYEELYDLDDDPDEKINLAAQYPEVAKRYRDVVENARAHKAEYYRRVVPISSSAR